MARWIGIGLVVIGMMTTVIWTAATVNGKTDENAAELERHAADMKAMKEQDKVLLEAFHRFDKRQTLIMHKLGVSEHGDPGEPGEPE